MSHIFIYFVNNNNYNLEETNCRYIKNNNKKTPSECRKQHQWIPQVYERIRIPPPIFQNYDWQKLYRILQLLLWIDLYVDLIYISSFNTKQSFLKKKSIFDLHIYKKKVFNFSDFNVGSASEILTPITQSLYYLAIVPIEGAVLFKSGKSHLYFNYKPLSIEKWSRILPSIIYLHNSTCDDFNFGETWSYVQKMTALGTIHGITYKLWNVDYIRWWCWNIVQCNIQVRIQDVKLGGALKKSSRAEGGAKFFGVFRL